MAFVQFTKVSLAFGDRDVLKDVSVNLASGTRAALAGANGSGKSTLMKVMAGFITPDSGERAIQKGSRVAYLPQAGIVHTGSRLRDELELAYAHVHDMLARMEEIGQTLASSAQEGPATAGLLDELHYLQEAVNDCDWYNRSSRISIVMDGLGFAERDLDRPVDEFSGGWQMRIALAKILLSSPDILLLDEPTNYLDIEARKWLEDWLLAYSGGYLLVSHDRYFLDMTCREVYEVWQGSVRRFAGNYTAYEKQRAVELESLLARYEAQQEEMAKTEDFIRRFRYQASKAAMVQDRVKRLEKIERIEIPESLKKIHFRFPDPPHCGRLALRLYGLGKAWGDHRVFRDLDLTVEAGEKLLVVGKNGAGKTTLLRILAAVDTQFEGRMEYGTDISVGYFSQDVAETITGNQSILDWLEADAPTHLIPRLRDMLGAFLFRGDDISKTLSVLSGGEKSRLALLALLLHPVNLLILDEPTNHLDLHSKDVLLDALKHYPGTVLFVSHDQGFMDALSTRTLELSRSGTHRLFPGNYAYYLERLAAEAAGLVPSAGTGNASGSPEATRAAGKAAASGASEGPAMADAGQAASFREEQKRLQTQKRRLERRETELLEAIERLEADLTAVQAEMQKSEVYTDGARSAACAARMGELEKQIEEHSAQWEGVGSELSEVDAALARLG